MNITYLLDAFPVISETFIVREMIELKRLGFRVNIFAKSKRACEIVHSDTKSIIQDVCYFSSLRSEISKLKLISYHLYYLLRRPSKYIIAAYIAVKGGRKIFHIFSWSACYAYKLEVMNTEHIHAHFALDGCTYAMFISMLSKLPYSFTVHAHDIFLQGKSRLEEEKLSRAKFIASISLYNKNYLIDKYINIDSRIIKIIHCGIDMSKISAPVRSKNAKFKIVSTGRLVEQKGFIYLVHACKILSDKIGISFTCEIIGEGERRQQLIKTIKENSLEKVVFLLGAMEQNAVMSKLNSADVFVLPCIVEKRGTMDGIPVALMEAMAMQTPVVSTKVSGIPELISNGGGVLVEPEDPDGLAAAIERIMTLSDRERFDMGAQGRRTIESSFNLENEVKELARLFQSI